MTSAALAETYRDLASLDRAMTMASLESELLRILRDVGVESFIAAWIPSARRPAHERRNNVLFGKWPSDWLEHYIQNNYVYIDPVVRAASGPGGVARWREAYGAGCDSAALRILDGARACALSDGLTFNFPTADSATAIVSLAGRELERREQDEGRLALIAQYAVGKSICLKAGRAAAESAPRLTSRERDVLMWTCEGKTDWEIGTILGVSEHCADKYGRLLKKKLAATSKTQLVARAFRLGLV